MRIIAGSRRGRTFAAPKGMDTRPTLDRVKESLFGILQFELEGRRVLDLFAGSGNLGLEALSRGARYALFNDHGRESAALIRANVTKLGFEDCARVLCMDYASAIRMAAGDGQAFDLVFLDPPYRAELGEKAMAAMLDARILGADSKVILEHSASALPGEVSGFALTGRRVYGDTALSFYTLGG